jgi:DNA-directed RNA polymerase specialized sigma24 family protein
MQHFQTRHKLTACRDTTHEHAHPLIPCPLTDADLLARYMQAGDESAFTALVRAHESLVIGTAARITGNVDLARDLAQQVFATLAQKPWMLTDRTSLAGWLHHAARHIALRTARSETARQCRHDQIVLESPAAPEGDVWPLLEEALAAPRCRAGQGRAECLWDHFSRIPP